jgi:Fe-S-cluster containining protein
VKKTGDKLNKRLAGKPRMRYPEDEAKYPWLSILLDACHLTDTGIAVELVEEERRRQSTPGCRDGCCNCCIKANVPVSPLEKLGICWFAVEKLTGEVRALLETQLRNHGDAPHCPFLVNSRCAIYPVRPFGCRVFFVFGKPCESPDNIGLIRKADIWTHSRDLARRVAMLMLPYYGIKTKADKAAAFEKGFIFSQMTPFRREKWEEVAEGMIEYERQMSRGSR